jgi:hypothetical protein
MLYSAWRDWSEESGNSAQRPRPNGGALSGGARGVHLVVGVVVGLVTACMIGDLFL